MKAKIRTAVQAVILWFSAFADLLSRFTARHLSKTTIEVVGSLGSGEGSCLIVRTGKTTVALDCGSNSLNGDEHAVDTTEEIAAKIFAAQADYLAISHAHHDHFGALSRIVEMYRQARIPVPAIVSTDPTWKLLERQLFDEPMSAQMLQTLGFRAKPDMIRLINSEHSVTGSSAMLLTGEKNIFYSSDFRAIDLPDNLPPIGVLIVASTKATVPGYAEETEADIRHNLSKLIREAVSKGDGAVVYVAFFSTQLNRAIWLEQEVQRITGYPPFIDGISLARNLNSLRPEYKGPHTNKVVLVTGAWAHGEENWRKEGVSSLVKLSNGKNRNFKLKEGDLVIISASIPVWAPFLAKRIKAMCQRIHSLGVRLVVDTSAPADWSSIATREKVHTSGHCNSAGIFELIDQLKPKQVLPFHASPTAREIVAEYCRSKGIKVISAQQGSRITL